MINKKAFTLVELVVTIAIMLTIVGIAVPSTIGIVNSSKDKQYESYIENFEKLAKQFWQEHNYKTSISTSCYKIDIKELLEDEIPINPKTEEEFTGYVEVRLKNSKLNYTYEETSLCGTNYPLSSDETSDTITMTNIDDELENLNIDVPPFVKDLMVNGNTLYVTTNTPSSKKSGIYLSEDDLGTTFYMYGEKNSTKTYVSFAGKKWQVVRVNGDGTVRLVLADAININSTKSIGTNTYTYNDILFADYDDKLSSVTFYNPSFGSGRANIGYSDYSIYNGLTKWYNSNISSSDKKNIKKESKYFCGKIAYTYNKEYLYTQPSENDTVGYSEHIDYLNDSIDTYKCTISSGGYNDSRNINTIGMLSKFDVENTGLIENGSNSFLYINSDWLLDTPESYWNRSECSKTFKYLADTWDIQKGCSSSVSSPDAYNTNEAHLRFYSYYVNNANISTKRMINIEGNTKAISDSKKYDTYTSYIENSSGNYVRLSNSYEYYPKSKVRYDSNGYKTDNPLYVNTSEDKMKNLYFSWYHIEKVDAYGSYYTYAGGGEIYIKSNYLYKKILSDADGPYLYKYNSSDGTYKRVYPPEEFTHYLGEDGTYYSIRSIYFKCFKKKSSGYIYINIDDVEYMKSNTGRYGEEIRMTQYYYSDGYFYKTPTGFGTVFNKYEPEYEKILTEDNKPVYYTTGTAYVYDYRPLKISIENMKVRPVINLKNTARISGGEGTKDNPFTLKFE